MDLRAMFGRHRRDGAPSAPAAPVMRAARDDWRSLPPLQRLTPATTTIDTGFGRQLATAGSPSFLGELGHLVAADGPAGLVSGLAMPSVADDTDHHDVPAPPERARRVDYGMRPAGRVTAPPSTPTLSRAPDPEIERRLAALEPASDAAPPHLDQPATNDAGDPGSSPDAHDAHDRSAPTIGASEPLVDEPPSTSVEVDRDALDRSDGPGATGALDVAASSRVLGPGAPSVATPLQRHADPPLTAADAGPDGPARDVPAEPQADPVAQRPIVSRRDDSLPDRASSSAGPRQDSRADTAAIPGIRRDASAIDGAIDGAIDSSSPGGRGGVSAIEGASDAGGGADPGDRIAPVLSRSAVSPRPRPRIGSPIDNGSTAPSDVRPVQRSGIDPPHPIRPQPRVDALPSLPARPDLRSDGGGQVVAPSLGARIDDPPTAVAPAPTDIASTVESTAASIDTTVSPVSDEPAGRSGGPSPADGVDAVSVQPLLGADPPTSSLLQTERVAPIVETPIVEHPAVVTPGVPDIVRSSPPVSARPAPTSAARVPPSQSTMARASDSVVPLRPLQRTEHTSDGASPARVDPDATSAPRVTRRPTIGLDGWTPGPAADAPSGLSGDGRSGDTAHVATAAVQRATGESGGPGAIHAPSPDRSAGGRPPTPTSTAPSRSAPAPITLPASIANAVGHASEITPLGLAALEASTVTWGDAPAVQRDATSPDSPPSFGASQFHAEAAWLPTDLQRASANAPPADLASADAANASGDAASPLGGVSEADVIGLMRTMYPHLRRRLTRDLLLDRERVGHRTDIRY